MHDAAVKIEGTAIEIILTLSFFLVQQVGTRLPVPYIPHDCARKAALTSQHPCYLGEIFVASLLDDIRVPNDVLSVKTRIHKVCPLCEGVKERATPP